MRDLEAMVVKAWLEASRDLGIRVVAPFVLTVNESEREYVALVRDFGRPKGILVAVSLCAPGSRGRIESFAATVMSFAASAGYGCSILNAASYSTYERQHFIDTLFDWGYAGPPDARPSWLASGKNA